MLKTKSKKITMAIITLFLIMGAFMTNIVSKPQAVEARGLVGTWLCKNDLTKKIYMMSDETDYFHYLTRSKSAIAKTQSVDRSVLNRLLATAGFEFNGANEAILGREISATSLSEISSEEANKSAPRVSAFDRFGMSGLTWSSYAGEWKYNHVDVCSTSQEVSPTNYGAFYGGRLEPKSSHNEVSTSKDARSIQFANGFGAIFGSTFMNILANSFFAVAKLVVTIAIVFVGLSFTDITTLIGFTSTGTGSASVAGVFNSLFNTIFTGFILITFMFTALYLLYNGLIKRQVRMAFNTLIKTIAIFIIAIIMAANPAYWVGMPNKIATYGQAVVLSSMSSLYSTSPNYVSLCETDIASIDEGTNIGEAVDEKALLTEFEKVSQNMKSIIGCQMWEQFLFKPWVRGQFGVEYEDLNSAQMGNINSDWVGNGSVPVGNDQTIDNWALFHLSTQTNAHAQIGNSNFPTYVNGVNADWWRVADTLSNYDEESIVESVSESETGAFAEQSMIVPVESDPLDTWPTWVGNNSSERLTTAMIAILFGFVGGIAPLIFGLSSAMMGLGITIMMMTSPIFLLLGTWSGKGDGIFMGWLSALVNMVLKRIGYSFLLVFSISIIMSIMSLAYEIGIITSFILLVIIVSILVKNKDKILGMMANVDFGGTFDPRTTANTYKDKQKERGKTAANFGLATISGGRAGVKSGQGFFRGAKMGADAQLKNTLYRSESGMHAVMEMEAKSKGSSGDQQICSMCFIPFGPDAHEVAYRDDDGNYYCMTCADELGTENLYDVVIGHEHPDNKAQKADKTRSKIATANSSYLSHKQTRDMMESYVVKGEYHWNKQKVEKMILENMKRLRQDIVVFSNVKLELGDAAKPPSVPEPLHSYIDLAMINEAWSNGNIEVVEKTYKEAWKHWYEDNGEQVSGLDEKEISKFLKEIDNFAPKISQTEAAKLSDGHLNSESSGMDKNIYSYKDGKLDFSKFKDDISKGEKIKKSKE